MLNLLKIWIPIALAAIFTLAGCSDDTLGTDPIGEDEELAGDVYIRIQMYQSGDIPGMNRAPSRAGETEVNETPGTPKENTINTVDILVYDIDDDMLVNRIPLDDQQIQLIQGETGAIVSFYAQQGHRVRIYAAVNMTDEMRRQFTFGRSGTDFSISASNSSYFDVINKFVPGSNGLAANVTGANGGIPMSGLFKIANADFNIIDQPDNDVITITKEHTNRNNPLNIMAEVSRIVAKVHVLVSMDGEEPSPTFVRAVKPTDNKTRFGWIRPENVRYIPNGINKSTYIFPQYENGKPKDMNMQLDKYVAGDKIDDQLWGADYSYTYNSKLYNLNTNPSSTTETATAEQYDETRLNLTLSGENHADRYVNGMYCPENYFVTPNNQTLFGHYQYAIPMITHVTIAAKMIPCVILVENDYVTKMGDYIDQHQSDISDADKAKWDAIKEKYFTTTTLNHGFIEITSDNEEDILFILNYSLKFSGQWSDNTNKYTDYLFPAGTFYVFDQIYDDESYTGYRYLCLTAGAVQSADDNTHIKSRSVPHIGGWGYYYTYIDNDRSTANGNTPYMASQVTRNTYYIITVGNFGYPGGTITDPMTIKANTVSIDWNYAGKGETNLH